MLIVFLHRLGFLMVFAHPKIHKRVFSDPFNGDKGFDFFELWISGQNGGFLSNGRGGRKAIGIRNRILGLDLGGFPDEFAIREDKGEGESEKILQELFGLF